MKKLLAVWLGKAIILVGKITGKKTTSAPGEYALRLCPNIIKDLNKYVEKGIIVTCGTNGKTTTNNMICLALENMGYKVMCNKLGANMLSGVVTAFLEKANLFGKAKVDYACFEIDEAYARIVFDYVKPDAMVITNLFRDQLDRYGEVELTARILQEAIDKVPNLKLILNGDDPQCVQFKNDKSIYYGVSEQVLPQEETRESLFCPQCGEKLSFNYHHYSQLGDFSCSSCGFKRPPIDVEVKDVSLKTPMRFTLNGQHIAIDYKGFYNIYNIAAVYSALNAMGENVEDFGKLLYGYKPQIGRMQEFKLNKPVILSLSKNPAGFNQAISTVNTDERKKDIIIAINDGLGDGQDVSWLWDVDFETLKNESMNTLTTTGIRKLDLSLRFKYSDIMPDFIISDMKEAISKALTTESEVVYVLVNYTALFSTEEVLNEMVKERGEDK